MFYVNRLKLCYAINFVFHYFQYIFPCLSGCIFLKSRGITYCLLSLQFHTPSSIRLQSNQALRKTGL